MINGYVIGFYGISMAMNEEFMGSNWNLWEVILIYGIIHGNYVDVLRIVLANYAGGLLFLGCLLVFFSLVC